MTDESAIAKLHEAGRIGASCFELVVESIEQIGAVSVFHVRSKSDHTSTVELGNGLGQMLTASQLDLVAPIIYAEFQAVSEAFDELDRKANEECAS